MIDNDDYLKPRVELTDNMYMQHLQEVNMYCPLCGRSLLKKKGERITKNYQVAHIYPNSPTKYQKEVLAGVERLGKSCEDFENKIALCIECHTTYDQYTTLSEYLRLLNLKKQIMSTNRAQESLSKEDIEKDIVIVIENLSRINDDELGEVNLKYKGVKIVNKLEPEYILLKCKLQSYVSMYYEFIKDNFKLYDEKEEINFNLIASQMKTAYLRAAETLSNKEIIFKLLVDWLSNKIPEVSEIACEIMISFFVQNCEVFDEIS